MKSDGYVNPTVSDIELKSNSYSKCQHALVYFLKKSSALSSLI